MNAPISTSLNSIYILQSLPSAEIQTGLHLYNDLLRYKAPAKGLNAYFYGIGNMAHFNQAFEEIILAVKAGSFPLIHFEIHGAREQGLVLSSKEVIQWANLGDRLRQVNTLCNNNLIVSLAACFGGFLFQEILPTKPSPFFGCLGPLTEVIVEDIEFSYNAFFDTLLDTLDLNEAVKVLNERNNLPYRYHFYHSEEVFEIIWKLYVRKTSNDIFQKERIKRLLAECFSNPNIQLNPKIRSWQLQWFLEKETTAFKEQKNIYKKQFMYAA